MQNMQPRWVLSQGFSLRGVCLTTLLSSPNVWRSRAHPQWRSLRGPFLEVILQSFTVPYLSNIFLKILAKRIYEADDLGRDDAFERSLYYSAFGTKDKAEGTTSFLEKRSPVWDGAVDGRPVCVESLRHRARRIVTSWYQAASTHLGLKPR